MARLNHVNSAVRHGNLNICLSGKGWSFVNCRLLRCMPCGLECILFVFLSCRFIYTRFSKANAISKSLWRCAKEKYEENLQVYGECLSTSLMSCQISIQVNNALTFPCFKYPVALCIKRNNLEEKSVMVNSDCLFFTIVNQVLLMCLFVRSLLLLILS